MLGYAGIYRGGKHELYEGGTRVPLIIRWPGHVPAGRVDRDNVVSMIDWLPTLCTLAGIRELPEPLDGEDVSDIWLGQSRERTKPLFWKTSAPGSTPVMRAGNWKLHLNPRRDAGVELYDLSMDPSESENLASSHPEIVAGMQRQLEAWVAELPESYIKKTKSE
jgi:N-acetylgalactosamine-6-sulfatase